MLLFLFFDFPECPEFNLRGGDSLKVEVKSFVVTEFLLFSSCFEVESKLT